MDNNMTSGHLLTVEATQTVANRYAQFRRPDIREQQMLDLAFTATVRGQQREAVLELAASWPEAIPTHLILEAMGMQA